MRVDIVGGLKRLNLAQRFMLTSLLVLLTGMAGVGWWVGEQIEAGVVHRTAATTALYVESFIEPFLQELGTRDVIEPEHAAGLTNFLHNTPLGRDLPVFKVWNEQGRILYSSNPTLVGQSFPVQGGLARAWRGEVAARVSDLDEDENELERQDQSSLLEMYTPIRSRGTGRIVAVVEFYERVDDLHREIAAVRWRTWLVFGAATLLMYVLLSGFVRSASDTIVRQQAALSEQVAQLLDLLAQNELLHERVRRAAARATALNERFLRRVSAELHDGPAQDLSLALLRLDDIVITCDVCRAAASSDDHRRADEAMTSVHSCLNHAMQEIRAISGGLGVPQLGELTISETVGRVVRAHERRTGTGVVQDLSAAPAGAPLPVKITLYRLIQEALNNAYRHAGGTGQRVTVRVQDDLLRLEISDDGKGFDAGDAMSHEDHLGLVGMRERVESLGGRFWIESEPGRGTHVIALLPLEKQEEDHERVDTDSHRGRSPAVPAGSRSHTPG